MISRLTTFCSGLQFRFLALLFGLAIFLLGVQLFVDAVNQTRLVALQTQIEAGKLANVIARSVEKQLENSNLEEVEGFLASVKENRDLQHISVIDRERTYQLDGDASTSHKQIFYASPAQTESMKSGKTQIQDDAKVITVAEPLIKAGETIGTVLIKYKKQSLFAAIYPVVRSKLSVIIPVLMLGMFLTSLLVTQITNPLRRLAEGATAFSDGDMDHYIETGGAREIRQLGDAINNMIDRTKENIEQIHELAYVDRVTQLPNREFFRKELTRSINRALRSGASGALLFVDLDGFKKVNDTLGHDLGDKLLHGFADRISQVLRKEDLVGFECAKIIEDENDDGSDQNDKANRNRQVLARLGGDEFTILLSEIREETDAATVARRIIDAVSEPFEIEGSMINIGASIGIATFPRDGSDYQNVLKSADMAMYQAKDEGKGTYRYYSQELNDRASNRMEIENDLRAALTAGNQLELYYQPKIDCRTGQPKGAEALIRWNHPEKGMIPPLDFIRIAEETGLILPLGKWILEEACRNIRRFQDSGIDISVAVNISTQQFEYPDFVNLVKSTAEQNGIENARLELEITESLAMSDPEKALLHINQLKECGIRIAIDDFGTGYSNLSQLSRLPFDVFKIDRSFVDGICKEDGAHDRTIVKTILAMAKSLNYQTVAEGVENEEQFQFLKENRCDFVQGYHFARPMPYKDMMEWMAAFTATGVDLEDESVNRQESRVA